MLRRPVSDHWLRARLYVRLVGGWGLSTNWVSLEVVDHAAGSGGRGALADGRRCPSQRLSALNGAVHLRGIPVGPMLGLTRRLILRSEEHTSELQSLMRISYAVFCLTNNKQTESEARSVIISYYTYKIKYI